MLEASSAHPAAIFESAKDWNAESVALQQACRQLGAQCSYALKEALIKRQNLIK